MAIKGYEFTDAHRIKEKFGKTIKENYPEASQPFIRFATAYWTFQICLLDDLSELQEYVAYLYLARLHSNIASIFFPTPGSTKISGNEREKIQREMLEGFDINIEEFITGNPILTTDKQQESKTAIWKKWWFWIIVGLVLLIFISVMFGK